jgi:hypothetical protein
MWATSGRAGGHEGATHARSTLSLTENSNAGPGASKLLGPHG